MRWLDQLIASVAPRYAIRRLQAGQSVKAFYEAAKPSNYHKRRVISNSPDEENKIAVDQLRIQARHLDENYDIGSGVLDVLVNNVVGLGIKPAPAVMTKSGKLHKDVNARLLHLWNDWGKNPEVTGDHRIHGLQRLLARSWFRDGEVLAQFLEGRTRSLDHRTQVPFSLEPLEADFLPTDLDDADKGIVQGVQKNKWGRAVAFHIYKYYPNGSAYARQAEMKKVPAERMLHLKFTKRFSQTRGVSVFATVLNRFDDIKEIEESERVAARVAAAMTGFIKKGSPDMYLAPNEDGELRDMEFSPGMVFDNLAQGEEVGTIASNRPNNALIQFRDSNLKAAAAGTGTSYSSTSKNFDGTYSSQRQELAEAYVNYGALWETFVGDCCDPVYSRFVRAAVTANLVDIPADVDMDTLYSADHSRPPLISVDPAKEMKGIEMELELGIVSKSQVQRRRGIDPDEVRAQIVRERELDEEAGIDPKMLEPGDEPTSSKNDNDEETDDDNKSDTK